MEAQNETPVAQPFFFELNVKEGGAASLSYQANAQMLFGVIIGACRTINDNFDNPLPSVGDFLRYMADAADEMDAENEQRNASQEDGQPTPA